MKLPSLYVECSSERAELNAALAKAQGLFLPVVKDEKGPFGFFASLNSMISATRPALAASGLSIIQPPQPVIDASGKLWCITELLHSSGQWYRSGAESLQFDNAQKTLAYFSYMRRLSYGGLLCLASCSDNDGEGLSEQTNQTVLMAKQKIQAATTVKEMEAITSRLATLKKSGDLSNDDADSLMEQALSKLDAIKGRQPREKKNAK